MDGPLETTKTSQELIKIAAQLDIKNPQLIMSYGEETAVGISKFSDQILSTVTNSSLEDRGELLKQLTAIMEKFEPQDFEEKKQGFLGKVLNKMKDDINKLVAKYQKMDKEISKIYVEIKKYEDDIKKSNEILDEMYEKNFQYYGELEKYIEAGFMVIEHVKNQTILQLQESILISNEEMDQIELKNTYQALEMIEARVHDLELAKMVSLQMAPQIKLIQKGNYNLLRKISSAFVITLPVFKLTLMQAMAIKKQKIQSDAMKALDDKTNELLLKNAVNIANHSVDLAKLISNPSIKIETLEETFNTIIRGIDETKEIERENKHNRENSRQRLAEIKQQLESRSNKTS
ncbi:toxic anion resistance protein [Alkaliphilus hydrothermalis]|uniref:Uncharacterized protein YaaN involved in tellurite resistance n=1 Tax=Alkaliphilus hydrothermalis TaxID=1482730 RepID=A0ABS2NN61_9FIRM|nr:toxic anion resistance protein [Alkaliphilus hydrothermalis]MBM7614390.1 uncharacterized protein YaaN involved in tellurite resistance [Alkaliphilus hydrothermalis]